MARPPRSSGENVDFADLRLKLIFGLAVVVMGLLALAKFTGVSDVRASRRWVASTCGDDQKCLEALLPHVEDCVEEASQIRMRRRGSTIEPPQGFAPAEFEACMRARTGRRLGARPVF